MFKYFLISIALLITNQTVLADASKDFKIFDLKKNLPLTDKEKVFYDYYINIGQEQGVQPGQIINVYRRVPVIDVYKYQNHPDMRVAVGKLKVIYTQKTMSVARLYKSATPSKTPVLEFEKMMVGDRVEKTNMTENDFKAKKQRPRKTASLQQPVAPKIIVEELKLPEKVAAPQAAEVANAVDVSPKKD
ncbi:MAG: hypothetical protein IPM57_07830 [Oligoflexia bacterium]|nr:hypothetical protein [Oligoflexia bacterium]